MNTALFLLSTFLLFYTQSSFAQSFTWDEAAQMEIEVESKPDLSGKAYQPNNPKPFLLLTSDNFDTPLLIDLSTKTVSAIPDEALTESGEHSYSSNGIPKGRKLTSYKVVGGVSTFSYKGKKVGIRIKESLVGPVTEGIILAHSPLYRLLADKYKPKKSAIDFIRNYPEKVEVVVIFATWCPTCKVVMPKFFKTMWEAGNKNFSYKYIGIAMGGNEPRNELEKYGYDYPSIIFYQNGKEKGRIIGEPPGALEDAMVGILKKKT